MVSKRNGTASELHEMSSSAATTRSISKELTFWSGDSKTARMTGRDFGRNYSP
jgi:hypothetical protein